MTVKQPDMCRLILIKGHTGYSGHMHSMQSGECQRLLHLGYNVNKYVQVKVNKKGNKLSSGVGTSTIVLPNTNVANLENIKCTYIVDVSQGAVILVH